MRDLDGQLICRGAPAQNLLLPHDVSVELVDFAASPFLPVLQHGGFGMGQGPLGVFTDLFDGPHAALVTDHFVADWRDEVPRLAVPVWVATGARSLSFPPEAMQWLADTLPDAQLTVYSDSGHTPHWNEPAAFNRDLLEFLSS